MFGNGYTQSQQASTSYRQLALVLLTTTRSSAPETTANINNNKIKVFISATDTNGRNVDVI